jgi:AcrR family transcriptional regulator
MVRNSNDRSNQAPPRRARRRDARRDAILRAAAGLFRRRGVAETGMRDIAVAADLSPANLYHYFRGKDEIVFYCQDRALDRLLASVDGARRTPGPAAATLGRVLAAHVRTRLDDVDGASAHLAIDALPQPLRARLIRKRDRYERAVRRLVADGIASGHFAPSSPAVVTRGLLGALNWTATWFRPDGGESASAVGETLTRFLLRGLAANGAAGDGPPGLTRKGHRRE